MKYIYKYGKDFTSSGGALTLNPSEVSNDITAIGMNKKTHTDGWTIKGQIHEDYYYWVNEFEAHHPKYGKVWGDFEKEVYAQKRKGFIDFYKKHTPQSWDYGDI